MKKLVCALLSTVLCVGVLAGCTSTNTDTSSQGTQLNLQSFSVNYNDFKTAFSDAVVANDAVMSEVDNGQELEGKTMQRLIVVVPNVDEGTISCLVDTETGALQNINISALYTPYFDKYVQGVLNCAGTGLDIETVGNETGMNSEENTLNKQVTLDGFQFTYSRANNAETLTIKPVE